MPLHRCAVDACVMMVRDGILMCRPHWFRVSEPTRERVWAAWRSYRNDPTMANLREYRAAVEQAKREAS